MDLSVAEVAKLLNVSERSVSRWAKQGAIPAYRVHDQYRFNRVELQEWATRQRRKVAPELFRSENGVPPMPKLGDALRRGGVHPDVDGATRDEVLAAVARLPGIPDSIDRELLRDLLVTREALAPTGIGGGIALPHPRDPLVLGVPAPIVLVCFLRQPVDFHAIDGQPVRVLFVLLSPTIQGHLQVLSRLAFLLHDDLLARLLAERAPGEAILERITALEEGMT